MPNINPENYAFTAAVANARAPDRKFLAEKYVLLHIRQYDEAAGKAISGIWTRMQGAIQSYYKHADEGGEAPGWSVQKVVREQGTSEQAKVYCLG